MEINNYTNTTHTMLLPTDKFIEEIKLLMRVPLLIISILERGSYKF